MGFVDRELSGWTFKVVVGDEGPVVLSGTATESVLAQVAVSAVLRKLQDVSLDRIAAR